MTASGVQVLIPETGKNGLDWIRDVNDAGGGFLAGAWLVVTGGLVGLIALARLLRGASPGPSADDPRADPLGPGPRLRDDLARASALV